MKTITFYSYKGGVGRSLILANVAKRLTEMGKNVCMLDFDLEAPGLEYKFSDYNKYALQKKGVVDFITSYTEDKILPQDISEYTSYIEYWGKKNHHGWLKLIRAGEINNTGYWQKLMSIDWKKLFYAKEGKGYELMLHLKALIEQQIKPDYLLVDSRTGITATSGVTLSILADEIVVVAVNNRENINGSLLVMKSIKESDNNTKPKIDFVFSRIPSNNEPKFREKEFDKIRALKRMFQQSQIDVSDIYVIHSDRELEENETLKIGDIENTGVICIENDYLHFFDSVIKPDLTNEEVNAFEIRVLAKQLIDAGLKADGFHQQIELLNESIKLDPENESAYNIRALVYESMGEIKKAEQDYLAYYQHTFKENYSTYYEVLAFYERHSMYQNLIDFTNKVQLDSYPIHIGHDIKSMIGRAYTMLKQYDKALEIYDKLIKEMPDIAENNFIISELYTQRGQLDEAEIHLNKALKIMPNFTYALYNMAIIQSKKQNAEDLIIYLDRALESDKSNQTKEKVATEPEFKKYKDEEAFQRILYKYNIRLKTEG